MEKRHDFPYQLVLLVTRIDDSRNLEDLFHFILLRFPVAHVEENISIDLLTQLRLKVLLPLPRRLFQLPCRRQQVTLFTFI